MHLALHLQAHGTAIVADATPEAFADSIDELLPRPQRRDELASAGREFPNRYDWSHVAVETARAYENLLARLREEWIPIQRGGACTQ